MDENLRILLSDNFNSRFLFFLFFFPFFLSSHSTFFPLLLQSVWPSTIYASSRKSMREILKTFFTRWRKKKKYKIKDRPRETISKRKSKILITVLTYFNKILSSTFLLIPTAILVFFFFFTNFFIFPLFFLLSTSYIPNFFKLKDCRYFTITFHLFYNFLFPSFSFTKNNISTLSKFTYTMPLSAGGRAGVQ